MGPRSVATKQDRNSCSGTSAGSRERSSWVGIPNYKRVLSHNQTKSSIYVSDTSRLVIRWDLVYKNMGQALYTERDPYSIDLEGPTCPSALRPNKLPLGGARVAGDGGAEPVAPTARHVFRQLHRRAAGQRLPGVASAALRDPRRPGGRAVRGRIPARRRDAGGAVLRTRRPAQRVSSARHVDQPGNQRSDAGTAHHHGGKQVAAGVRAQRRDRAAGRRGGHGAALLPETGRRVFPIGGRHRRIQI